MVIEEHVDCLVDKSLQLIVSLELLTVYADSFENKDRNLAEAIIIVVFANREVNVVAIDHKVKVLHYVLDELPLLLVSILGSWLVLEAVPELQ